ncbi:hypothetical protein V5799_010943 [Amblyomma americanum]|uniref:Peptidase M13 N-terminal domain-containing protein n=1 Tax=Amblyomma americanum TaxID=6943 RepID=A0AAQ4EIH0_AMBAM
MPRAPKTPSPHRIIQGTARILRVRDYPLNLLQWRFATEHLVSRESKDSVRPVSRLEVIVAVSAFVVLVVVVVLGIIRVAWARPPAVSNVCLSHACRAYADQLLLSINKSVNPCHDFTRFVCDGWQRQHHLTVWQHLFKRILSKLDHFLKSTEWRVVGQNEEQRAAAVYQSCDSVFRGDNDELPAVAAALADAGIVWPRPSVGADALRTLLYCSLRLGWDTLLHFVVDETQEVVLSPGRSLRLVLRGHLSREKSVSKQAYFRTLRSSFRREGAPSVSYENMSAVADPALSLLLKVYERGDGERYSVDWVLRTTGTVLTEARLLKALGMFNLSLPDGLRLSTTQPEYLWTLLDIWKSEGEDSFHLFVSWCTVQVAALYANKPLIMNYYDNHVHIAAVQHKAFCVSRAVFFSRQATFGRYNADVLQGNSTAVARGITLAVRAAFNYRLSRWAHYDENITVVTNWASLDKVFRSFKEGPAHELGAAQVPDMTESFVGNWQNSVFLKNPGPVEEIVQSICELSLYIPLWGESDFQLMPYSLTFPLFDIELPEAINYGGLGGQVASAIGALFLESYHELNVSKVFSECIAPAGAEEKILFYTAYASGYGALVDAFKMRGPSLSPAIPSFGEYTDLQLLFIASCYTLCLGKGNHPRCDMIVQHVPEFSDAFQCSSDQPMNRSHQCQLL